MFLVNSAQSERSRRTVAAVCVLCRRLGEAVPFPAGAAHIIKEGDIPLSDSEEGEGRHPPRSQPARHPDEELEAEQAAAEQQEHSDDWEPDAAAADSDEEGLAAAAAALRLSPPPVSAAELASGELEVVSAEEDRRMIELLRQQVRVSVAAVVASRCPFCCLLLGKEVRVDAEVANKGSAD
jgi:hypothetical protein